MLCRQFLPAMIPKNCLKCSLQQVDRKDLRLGVGSEIERFSRQTQRGMKRSEWALIQIGPFARPPTAEMESPLFNGAFSLLLSPLSSLPADGLFRRSSVRPSVRLPFRSGGFLSLNWPAAAGAGRGSEREARAQALRFFLRFQRKSCENIGPGKRGEGERGKQPTRAERGCWCWCA